MYSHSHFGLIHFEETLNRFVTDMCTQEQTLFITFSTILYQSWALFSFKYLDTVNGLIA